MRRLVKQFTSQLTEALEIGEKANLNPSTNYYNRDKLKAEMSNLYGEDAGNNA